METETSSEEIEPDLDLFDYLYSSLDRIIVVLCPEKIVIGESE